MLRKLENQNITQNFIYDDVPEEDDMTVEEIEIFVFCVKWLLKKKNI